MLNMLPKSMIINHIVDTLGKDPENGVVKLLEKVKSNAKTEDDRVLTQQVMAYYATSATARMQVRNLVYNTNRRMLYAFAEAVYDALQPPIMIGFMRMMTIADAAKLTFERPIFPIIDLKNLNEPTKEVLAQLKNNGQIFFASISVTEENFDIVTADEVILALVKHGVRGIFYRMPEMNTALEAHLLVKIDQIRRGRPILAFLMKKDLPSSKSLNYMITEKINGKEYGIRLNLR